MDVDGPVGAGGGADESHKNKLRIHSQVLLVGVLYDQLPGISVVLPDYSLPPDAVVRAEYLHSVLSERQVPCQEAVQETLPVEPVQHFLPSGLVQQLISAVQIQTRDRGGVCHGGGEGERDTEVLYRQESGGGAEQGAVVPDDGGVGSLLLLYAPHAYLHVHVLEGRIAEQEPGDAAVGRGGVVALQGQTQTVGVGEWVQSSVYRPRHDAVGVHSYDAPRAPGERVRRGRGRLLSPNYFFPQNQTGQGPLNIHL